MISNDKWVKFLQAINSLTEFMGQPNPAFTVRRSNKISAIFKMILITNL